MLKTKKIIPFLIPFLLILVAINQQYLAHFHDLSPWKGGGFGMFSTIKGPSSRFLRVFISTQKGETPVQLSKTNKKKLLEIKTIPTKNKLEKFGQNLLLKHWKFNGEDEIISFEMNSKVIDKQLETIKVESIRIELWEYNYERKNDILKAIKKMEVHVKNK